MLYSNTHRNRSWTLLLETYVLLHAVITALAQTRTSFWQLFAFGFGFIFVLNQVWGFPPLQMYLNAPKDAEARRKRYLIVLTLIVSFFFGLVFLGLKAYGDYTRIWFVFALPVAFNMSLGGFFGGYVVASKAESFLVEKKILTKFSCLWYVLGSMWAIIVYASQLAFATFLFHLTIGMDPLYAPPKL
jgi:hypothetical protein